MWTVLKYNNIYKKTFIYSVKSFLFKGFTLRSFVKCLNYTKIFIWFCVFTMAFNLGDRFPAPPKYFTLLDPGAYNGHINPDSTLKSNKVPFLSKTLRNTQSGVKIWTHTLYYADYPPRISNCTSFMSKKPRFPYKTFTEEDSRELLCRCGIEKQCDCPAEHEQVVCQANIRKRLFKGHTPTSILSEGLSCPAKTGHGFNVLINGSVSRIQDKITSDSPPFYDTDVKESSAFYRGCKWSKWTSSRSTKILNTNPGPAHYTYTRERTKDQICSEKLRSFRRQTSKQLRFIEIVQQRDILDGRPGPATYNPQLPKGHKIKYIGQKSDRFPKKQYDQKPGPADHWLQRDFDPIVFSGYKCHAKLPKPSCFGVKALRFQPHKEEGPSPASYYPNYKLCNYLRCSTAPFSVSTKRFKSIQLHENYEEDEQENKYGKNYNNKNTVSCLLPTWVFRSNTVRLQKLNKKLNEPSPADLPQTRDQRKRSRGLQYIAPFFSSEGRFQPWYNWIPVHGKLNTPGPCSYNLEKPKCYPVVHRGPLFRARRFQPCKYETPAPNEYHVGGNIESILETHNKKLKHNISNKHKFIWEPPVEQRKLSFEEQENLLLYRSIALLNTNNIEEKNNQVCNNKNIEYVDEIKNKKLLRCFLYNKQMPCV